MDAEIVEIALADLRPGSSPRRHPLNAEHVRALAAAHPDWPPILIGRVDRTVIDGYHRIAAAEELGLTQVVAALFDGTEDEAFIEAVRRNAQGAFPMTLAERKDAGQHLLADHGEWADRLIAEICALSPRTIGRLRLAAGKVKGECRVGRDGRGRPVHPEITRGKITEALAAHPDASLRSIAVLVGASPETVRRVRRELRELREAPGIPPILTPVATVTLLPRPSRPRPAPASADQAITSTAAGQHFADWFGRTDIDDDWIPHVTAVPLSRAYQVADEARRRAQRWAAFAEQVERRTRGDRTMLGVVRGL